MLPPYCLYTSLVILALSCIRCAVWRTWTNVLLFIVGTTSVMHHRRLDRWHYYDWITVADWVAVVVLMGHLYAKHGWRRPLQNALIVYAISIVLLNRLDLFCDDTKIRLHTTVHALVILCLCVPSCL